MTAVGAAEAFTKTNGTGVAWMNSWQDDDETLAGVGGCNILADDPRGVSAEVLGFGFPLIPLPFHDENSSSAPSSSAPSSSAPSSSAPSSSAPYSSAPSEQERGGGEQRYVAAPRDAGAASGLPPPPSPIMINSAKAYSHFEAFPVGTTSPPTPFQGHGLDVTSTCPCQDNEIFPISSTSSACNTHSFQPTSLPATTAQCPFLAAQCNQGKQHHASGSIFSKPGNNPHKTTKVTKRKGRLVSREDLLSTAHMRIEDARNAMSVGLTTFKVVKRIHHIQRWPFRAIATKAKKLGIPPAQVRICTACA